MSSQKEDSKESKNENDDDQWEDLYDESEETMLNKLSELTIANKKISSKPKPESEKKKSTSPTGTSASKSLPSSKIDYLKFEPKKPDEESPTTTPNTEQDESNDEFSKPDYAHMIEIYDFPTCFKNENIINAFTSGSGIESFAIKWVDDTHCLGLFSNAAEAQKALKIDNQACKARTISESSEQTRQMAKRKLDYLKPYKPRPQTSSLVANRLIGASLGIRLPKEKLDQEKTKLKLAKEKNQKDKDLKESVWNGETS